MRRTRWRREKRPGPRSARSCASERESADVAAARAEDAVEAFDTIHERAHEEQAAAVLALEVLGIGGVADVAVEVEGLAFVLHVDDEAERIHIGADADPLFRILVVGAQDR